MTWSPFGFIGKKIRIKGICTVWWSVFHGSQDKHRNNVDKRLTKRTTRHYSQGPPFSPKNIQNNYSRIQEWRNSCPVDGNLTASWVGSRASWWAWTRSRGPVSSRWRSCRYNSRRSSWTPSCWPGSGAPWTPGNPRTSAWPHTGPGCTRSRWSSHGGNSSLHRETGNKYGRSVFH